MKKTIIFFPIEIGVAHLSRSLAVAEELHARGNKVLFAIPERKKHIFASSPVTFIIIKNLLEQDTLMSVKKLIDANYLKSFIHEDYELIKKYKPDCIVADFNLSALVAAYALDVPIVNITGSGALPYGCYIPNPDLNKLLYTFIDLLLNKALWNMKSNIAKALVKNLETYGKKISVNEFFDNMHYIVPEHEGYLQARPGNSTISYVGPLAWDGFRKKPFALAPSKKKTIYLSFGGTGFDGEKLIELSSKLLNSGYRVVVSSSTIAKAGDFTSHKDLIVAPFVNGQDVSRCVDLVVCHGGYGTMCDAINAGKPIVAIPFNPDQLLHAFRFQEYGLAVSTINFSPLFLLDFVKMNWTRFQNLGSDVPTEIIMEKIHDVFSNYASYTRNIQKMKHLFSEEYSVKKAADLVEKIKG